LTHIYIVEDDPLMAELLDTLLSLEGYQVSVEMDFRDLEVGLRQNKPDLLLIDVNLRGANGLDIIKRFRETDPDQTLTIIAQSGIENRQLALRCGADAFILKPYDCDELIQLIKEIGTK